tara:strand:+ start:97 stop:237 length:141 start_codon:yes stop_codon:yes gene_type:complete
MTKEEELLDWARDSITWLMTHDFDPECSSAPELIEEINVYLTKTSG